MKYEIMRSNDFFTLQQEVQKMLDEGWEPAGGICVNSWDGLFYQALVLPLTVV